METGWFPFDDGPTGARRRPPGKTERHRRVRRWAGFGRDVGWRKRQEDRGITNALQQMDSGMGVEVVCP